MQQDFEYWTLSPVCDINAAKRTDTRRNVSRWHRRVILSRQIAKSRPHRTPTPLNWLDGTRRTPEHYSRQSKGKFLQTEQRETNGAPRDAMPFGWVTALPTRQSSGNAPNPALYPRRDAFRWCQIWIQEIGEATIAVCHVNMQSLELRIRCRCTGAVNPELATALISQH